MNSLEDLKTKFKQEYPTDQLISIPVVKLQDYRSVPVHLTEDDVRANINLEEEEILRDRTQLIRAKRHEVLNVLNFWQNNFQSQLATQKAAEDLNDLLFEFIFTGAKDCTCSSCQTKSCTHTSSRRCNVNKGQKTQREKAKHGFKFKWEEALTNLQTSDPDLSRRTQKHVDTILDYTIEELKNGIYLKMKNEIHGIFANMKGRNSENNLTAKLEQVLQGRRGLLLNGFNVKENLKLFFAAFNIKLRKERKEIEHDVLHIAPHKDKVLVNFVQAKSQLNVPWTEVNAVENARRVIEKACSQGVVDVETFSDLASYFLTDDQFKMINMNFNITMSDLSQLPETELCVNCREAFVYDEDKGKENGATYNSDHLLTLFRQPNKQEAATPETEEVFMVLSAIYAGGGSLVKLKCPKEKYKKETFYLKQTDKVMKKTMTVEGKPLDKTSEKNLNNVKLGVENRWISRNANIKLSPAQSNLYNSGIGLETGYCMIGGHGTGKTMMIQLEVSRAARLHTDEGTKAQIIVVVWEMKAKELFESYKRFAVNINHSSEVELKFLNKEALCQETQVEYERRDTTSIINDVIKKLSETKDRAVYLFIDEIEVENPGMADLKDLIGKTPFCLGGEIFPWSNLEPLQVRLVVAVTTDSQDLAKLVEVDEADEQRMKSALVSAPPEKIPAVVLWRVFRCSNAIQDTVEYLQLECSKKDKEFGFAVNPRVQIRGHDVRGDLVEWIPCNETEHMICPEECQECFLKMIDGALTEKLKTLEATVGVASSEVTLIVSNFSQKRTPADNRIKEFLARNHPNIKVKLNFEMEGLEAPTVILIRNGGHLGSAISLGVSRATTKLVMISTDDNEIMEKAVRENKVKKVNLVQDTRSIYDHVKIPEESDQARWSLVGSALYSLHTSLPGHMQTILKNFLENQAR